MPSTHRPQHVRGATAKHRSHIEPALNPEIGTGPAHAGTEAQAVSYVHMGIGEVRCWGVGIDVDSVRAALAALVSAVNAGASVKAAVA